MPVLNSFFCFSLRAGTITIGCLHLLLWISLSIALSVFSHHSIKELNNIVTRFDFSQSKIYQLAHEFKMEKMKESRDDILIMCGIVLGIGFLECIPLIAGAVWRKMWLLLPYLIFYPIQWIIQFVIIIATISFLVSKDGVPIKTGVVVGTVFGILIVLGLMESYFYFIVLSYLQCLRSESQRKSQLPKRVEIAYTAAASSSDPNPRVCAISI